MYYHVDCYCSNHQQVNELSDVTALFTIILEINRHHGIMRISCPTEITRRAHLKVSVSVYSDYLMHCLGNSCLLPRCISWSVDGVVCTDF